MKALRHAIADTVELVLTLLLLLLALPIMALVWLSNLPVPDWAEPLFKIAWWLLCFWLVHWVANWFFEPQQPSK